MIVVDVNVIAYLLIDGEHTRAIEVVFAVDPEWSAPMLWRSEWRNVLAGYFRRGAMDQAKVLENIRAAEALLSGREHMPDGEHVIELVSRSTCSAYDCEYVAVAEALDIPLVTADRRILRDFPTLARSPETFAS